MRSALTLLFATLTVVVFAESKPKEDMLFSKRPTIHQGPFGSCCDDLKKCMAQPNALIRVSEDKTLFLTIGYVETGKGLGWFDHAVIYCPFCGKQLQDREELKKKAAQAK